MVIETMAIMDLIAFIDMSLILTTLTFLFAVFVVRYQRPRNIPPGPWNLPILGYLPNIAVYSRWYSTPLPALMTRLSKIYGPVFSLYLGDQLCVVLNNHEVVRDAFKNPKLNDRPNTARNKNDQVAGLLRASGQSWRDQRAFTLDVFRRFGVGRSSFENQICTELQILLKQFEKNSWDPTSSICTSVSNIMSSVTIGKRYDHGDREFQELLHTIQMQMKLSGAGGLLNLVKILRLLPSKTKQKFEEVAAKFGKIVTDNVSQRETKFVEGSIDCLVDVYLTNLAANKLSPYVNNVSVANIVKTLFIAGVDTTSNEILWVLVYLLRHPHILKKVQEEIDSVVGRDRLPRMADKSHMPFTQAVILETMRLAPVVPTGVMHAASADTTLQEYTIPKGTMLISNLWGIQNDTDVWPDPRRFDPGRFLNAAGEVVENESLIPFSAGRRVCPGEHLAKMEIFLFITHILHQFDLKVPEGEPEPSLDGTFALSYTTKPFVMSSIKRE